MTNAMARDLKRPDYPAESRSWEQSSEWALAPDSPHVLVLLPPGIDRFRIEGALGRAGFSCAWPIDEASAVQCVQSDPALGVVLTDAGASIEARQDFLAILRQRAGRHLSWILMVRDVSLDTVQEAIRAQVAAILPATPDDEAIARAAQAAAADYAQATRGYRLSMEDMDVLNSLADLVARLRVQRHEPPRAVTGSAPSVAGATWTARDLVRILLRLRDVRDQILGEGTVDDAAFAMLLDLLLAHLDRQQRYVTALCAGAGVPLTTALRRLDGLITQGYAVKAEDPKDQRRILVLITPRGIERAMQYVVRFERELAALRKS